MSVKDRETLSKPKNISFHIALQRIPFTVFQNQAALEKLQGVKFTGAYSVANSGRSLVITDHLDLLVGQ